MLARRPILCAALGALLAVSRGAAGADLLSDLSLVYLEDFAGETGSPMTPEFDPLGIGGAIAFKQLGNGAPGIAFGYGVILFSVAATAGSTPVEQAGVHVLAGVTDDGEIVGVGAPFSSWNTDLGGDGQLFAGVYLSSSSVGIAATVQETTLEGANEIALVLAELDVTGGTTRPSQSAVLDAAARAAVEGGQAFLVELRYDRGAEVARARLTAPGVQVDTQPLSPTLLDGVTLSFAGAAARAVNVLGSTDLGRDDAITVAVEELALLAPEPAGVACGLAALGVLAVSVRAGGRRRA
jgi:hypothetical protein